MFHSLHMTKALTEETMVQEAAGGACNDVFKGVFCQAEA